MVSSKKTYNQRYYAKHRSRLLRQQKKYYKLNKELIHKRSKVSKAKYRAKNKENLAAWNKEYYKRNKAAYFRRHIKQRYGISIEEYSSLLERSKGHCEICKRKFTKRLVPCLDHCHTTGKSRGILCRPCNVHLGWHEKNEQSANKYLRNNS